MSTAEPHRRVRCVNDAEQARGDVNVIKGDDPDHEVGPAQPAREGQQRGQRAEGGGDYKDSPKKPDFCSPIHFGNSPKTGAVYRMDKAFPVPRSRVRQTQLQDIYFQLDTKTVPKCSYRAGT